MELRLQNAPFWMAVFVFLLSFQDVCEAAAYAHHRRLAEAFTSETAPGPAEDYPYEKFTLSCDFQGQFPYMASLRDAYGQYRCGAVLIQNNTVLTAASCVVPKYGDAPAITEVFLGGFERESPVERRPVVAIFPHEDFTGNPADGADIAIVKLGGETCMNPVPFLGRQTAPGEQYIVLGFGRTGPTEPVSALLQGANVTNFDIRTCNEASGVTPPLDDTMICTQGDSCSCGSVCEGDEGGPLILSETLFEFKDTLMGIVSYSTKPCDEAGGFGVYTDVQAYLNWIERTEQSAEFLCA